VKYLVVVKLLNDAISYMYKRKSVKTLVNKQQQVLCIYM
jgi:hypothetical protein